MRTCAKYGVIEARDVHVARAGCTVHTCIGHVHIIGMYMYMYSIVLYMYMDIHLADSPEASESLSREFLGRRKRRECAPPGPPRVIW